MIAEYFLPYKDLIFLSIGTLAAIGLVTLVTSALIDNGWLAFIGAALILVPLFLLVLVIGLVSLIEGWVKVIIAIAGA